jgi:hypothetical protein
MLSAEQRTDMWRRWKAGESLHEIGRAFGKDHGSIQFLLSQRGGIVPAARRQLAANAHGGRAGRHLTRNCFQLVDSGDSQRVAAAASTVSREVARHGGRPLYRRCRQHRRPIQRLI